jgi:hypothetical protein
MQLICTLQAAGLHLPAYMLATSPRDFGKQRVENIQKICLWFCPVCVGFDATYHDNIKIFSVSLYGEKYGI